MPLASRSRPSIPASRAWRTRKSGWSLSSRCGRPARDGPPRVGSLPRLSSWRGLLTCLAFAAWWQDVKWEKSLQKKAPPRPPPLAPELLQERVSTTGRFGGKTPGEIDLHPSKEYTRALARSSPCGHPPPQRPRQLSATRTGLPSGWAGRACRSGGEAGCGGALTPAQRRRPRLLRTAQVSEGEGAIAAAVSRARGEADSPCGVLVEMSTQPRLPASEALTRSPTPRHPLHPSTDPANTARGRCEGHAYDGHAQYGLAVHF